MSIDGQSETADGTVENAGDGRSVISFSRRLHHPVESVWAALTQGDQLINWWGQAVLDVEVGGEFTMRWLNTDKNGDSVTMQTVITQLEPESLLETRGDPHGVLRWELRDEGGEVTGLAFSSTLELPDEYRAPTLAGWHYHLDALAGHLAGEPTDLVNLPNDRWNGLYELYGEKLA
ncbi:SRPBCC domain-containing protein [Spelaeicoccus albus]|uniref:Uncharacterized protein YndB with AHSA1/START domain n=1 Tax=Spelaeicoccus albus TaxID=1280376 RepID=A0A7Z0AA04_9MICO|nr:SRPBCC domain-containing protein [Spelaeicoccus albus]NYI67139.1 uncharacterized protein YndB with AHSA1/START domain [Spelaeicoccus albus]